MITINLFHAVLFVHSFIITYQFTRHPLGTGSLSPPLPKGHYSQFENQCESCAFMYQYILKSISYYYK